MSNLIFLLALGALSLPALAKFLSENLSFEGTPAQGVWRGRVKEGPYNVDVIVRRSRQGVHIILADRSIPKEICERVARRLAVKLNALVNPLELPPEKVEVVNLGAASTHCHYCLGGIQGLPYRCSRCGGFYCAEHRLPEEHDCPGDHSATAREATTDYQSTQPKRRQKGALVIQEVPCG